MPEVHVYIEIDDLARGEAFYVARHWTPVHLDFVVDDLDSAVERAVAAGAVLERRVDHPGLWRLAALADPFGHGVDLIESPEAGYEQLAAARS